MYALMCFATNLSTDSFNYIQIFDESLQKLLTNESDLSLGKQINAR
jgi:hypothetical protein